MTTNQIIFTVATAVIGGAIGLLLFFFPTRVVGWQTRWQKGLVDQVERAAQQGMSPRQRDWMLTTIQRSQRWTANLRLYRVVGFLFLLDAVVGVAVIGIWLATGLNPFAFPPIPPH